ncbi:putative membrane protein [Metabacillus crassostreae]|uniref:hypothetical protein n=1 Tax=Metabacillus crassostreae TaxID=929098 RepID=UPI00195B6808|nr:hypothetical protein [Metabacillus crassostreae]MBM7602599.1 putative membrane protein [Metabacillus crassostreae]
MKYEKFKLGALLFMFDITFLLIMAFAGGTIAFISILVILGRRITEPKKEIQQKVKNLEEEVQKLKNEK